MAKRFGLERQLARILIPELYRAFGSANKALEFLREVGLGYRRADFLADWREWLGIEKKRDTWRFAPKKYLPPDDWFVETEKDIRGRYAYIAKVRYIDEDTGELAEKYISFLTDYKVSFAEAERRWTEIMFTRTDESPKKAREIIDIIRMPALKRKPRRG